MPYVDSTNVQDFIGKTVDCERRRLYHYPLTFREIRGQFYSVDRNHVMIPLAEGSQIYYDFIVGVHPMDFERFDELARTDSEALLTALELLWQNGRAMICSQDAHRLTGSCAASLCRLYTAKKLHEIVTVCKELADLETNTLADYIHRGSLMIANPDADEKGICPICGGSLEYGGDIPLDDKGVYEWTCPSCGATGKEGYNKVFDRHYSVHDGGGRPYPAVK